MPQWTYTINLGDVFHDERRSFEEKRDIIVDRLASSRWLRESGPGSSIAALVEQLRTVRTVERFDRLWAKVYDQADWDRAWIDTLSR
jgi:hypothetical protein